MTSAKFATVAVLLMCGGMIGTGLFLHRPAHANAPGTKWGDQIEVGTVGNSTVIKVNDDGLICLVLQPRGGGTPAFNCWGSP